VYTFLVARRQSFRFALRVPGDLLVQLRELALAQKVKLSAYIIRVLREHCTTAPRPRAALGGMPSGTQYANYCRDLDLLFATVDGRIADRATTRGRTQFNKWAARVSGESNPTKRSTAQWDAIFKKAESYGDIHHKKSEDTMPNERFAVVIKRAADEADRDAEAATQLKEFLEDEDDL